MQAYLAALWTCSSAASRAFVRQGKWKISNLEGPFDENRFELFDLSVDPGETTDLSTTEPEVFTDMLETWRQQRKEPGIAIPGDL